MSRRTNRISVLLIAVLLNGCSVFPYEEHFACEARDNYGRCTSVDGAYKQALTGEPQGPKIKRSGAEDDFGAVPVEGEAKGGEKYEGAYRRALYHKLRNMIEEPATPMVKPAHVVRTLILTYKTEGKGTPLFMPRYVFFFGDDPTWVLGEQESRKQEPIMSLIKKEKPGE